MRTKRSAASELRDYAKKHGHEPKFVRDMREVFDDKSVDFVSTATPNHWHALCGDLGHAGRQGRLCRKAGQSQRQRRPAHRRSGRKYKKICQTGTQCRSMPGGIDAIEYVKSRKIGDVKLARGLCYKPRRIDRPRGHLRSSGQRRLQSMGRSGSHAAADAAEVPLRLALAMGVRQRRLGQPRHSSGRRRPLGTGRQRTVPRRAQLRRPLGL